jgi:AcrR family transcriptional regulator
MFESNPRSLSLRERMKLADSLQPRRQPSQDRAKVRLEKILAATRLILLESGIGGVTTASIAERAGVPVGSVYQYFPNKKAIFLELYRQYLDRLHALLERFEHTGPYDEGWVVFNERLLAAVRRAESKQDVEAVLLAASQTFPELQEYQAAHLERIVETWARILQRLGSRWSRIRLTRLLRYLYLLNAGSVTYQRQFRPPERERREWDKTIMIAGLRLCMPP